MFSTREAFATNDELVRQQEITDVVLYGKSPTTFIRKKAAAIYGHKAINIIAHAKILQSIDYILTFITSDDDLHDLATQERIRSYLRSENLKLGTPIMLHKKLPILTLQPEPIPSYPMLLDTDVISPVNIADFEYMCFENRIRFRYLQGTKFATYMYQNLLHYLNAKTSDELIGNESWQAQFTILIERTNYSDYVATQAFYDDSVAYRGIIYDTSFVPKYDVRNLTPQDPINSRTSDDQMINYYYSLNERVTTKVPMHMIGIFLTFPFKNGHYIRPTCEIVHLKLKTYNTLKSSRIIITNLCDMYDVESAIESAARSIPLDDVIYHAVYSKNLKEQSIALLILRRLVGDTLTIGDERINIPTEINVLSWSKHSCSKKTLILPPIVPHKSSQIYLELVQDIASSCGNKLSASLICHKYFIPEIHISEIYANLKSDAEKYILLLLVLQEYRMEMYKYALKQLNPVFGNSEIDLSKYAQNNRLYLDTLITDRLDTMSEPLLLPSDVSSNINACTPYSCLELYEFTNPQLNELAKYGDVTLDQNQLARFIALMVYNK
nr:gp76-like protein [Oryctes rhinoceros nudivirus]